MRKSSGYDFLLLIPILGIILVLLYTVLLMQSDACSIPAPVPRPGHSEKCQWSELLPDREMVVVREDEKEYRITISYDGEKVMLSVIHPDTGRLEYGYTEVVTDTLWVGDIIVQRFANDGVPSTYVWFPRNWILKSR